MPAGARPLSNVAFWTGRHAFPQMIDPLTAAAVGGGLWLVGRFTVAHVEVTTLRARTELTRAVANLTPGTEISGAGPEGSRWVIRVPAPAAPFAPCGGRRG